MLPALLSLLGDRVEKGRIPLVHRLRSRDGDSRLWGAIVDRVLRRPKLAAVLATALGSRWWGRVVGPSEAGRRPV